MKPNLFQHFKTRSGAGLLLACAVVLAVCGQAARGQAVSPADHQNHHPTEAAKDVSLADQITELRAQVARLQAQLDRGHQTHVVGSQAGPSSGVDPMGVNTGMQGMPMMGGMQGMAKGGMQAPSRKGMGMMGMEGMPMMDMMGGMQGMGRSGTQASSIQGMGMMGMDGMKMMGRMGKQRSGTPSMVQSALPGFPGSSHLYHLGATGYFLDHTHHITLTRDQQTALNQIKERHLLARASADRQIEQAEQDLWVLTGSDQPDIRRIEAKVREIKKLEGDRRLGFIRAVGDAASVLTDGQRKVLVGEVPTDPQPATSQPSP